MPDLSSHTEPWLHEGVSEDECSCSTRSYQTVDVDLYTPAVMILWRKKIIIIISSNQVTKNKEFNIE